MQPRTLQLLMGVTYILFGLFFIGQFVASMLQWPIGVQYTIGLIAGACAIVVGVSGIMAIEQQK